MYVINSEKDWKMLIYSGIDSSLEKIKELYLKRWDIEKAFKNIKEFWVEKVRLRDFEKISKILIILQFIYNIIVKVYIRINKVQTGICKIIMEMFSKFVKKQNLTNNFHAFIKFFSQKIYVSELYNFGLLVGKTLFPVHLFSS